MIRIRAGTAGPNRGSLFAVPLSLLIFTVAFGVWCSSAAVDVTSVFPRLLTCLFFRLQELGISVFPRTGFDNQKRYLRTAVPF